MTNFWWVNDGWKRQKLNFYPQRLSCLLTIVWRDRNRDNPGLFLNSEEQKRNVNDVANILRVSIRAELAWTTDTDKRLDRDVLSMHYNGKISKESWLSLQYGGETKGYRDIGTLSEKGYFCMYWGTDFFFTTKEQYNQTIKHPRELYFLVLCHFCDEGTCRKTNKKPPIINLQWHFSKTHGIGS